jgi:DnaK suppressor protein
LDCDALRKRLLDERDRLLKEIGELDADLAESLHDASEESTYDQHLAETAAITLEREMELSLEENARASIAQLDRALKKLEDGSYGICDRCGQSIAEQRLETAPDSTLCIGCRRVEERKR